MSTSRFVDVPALRAAGGEIVDNGIRIGGWTIQTWHAPIIGESEVESYKSKIGGVLNIPEIVFGNNMLCLCHQDTGAALWFTALDALKAWQKEKLDPLQVSFADEWQEARQQEIKEQGAMKIEYDWTYTTPYLGTVGKKGEHHVELQTDDVDQMESKKLEQTITGNRPSLIPITPAVTWAETTDSMDWGLLTAQDPILFYDTISLYESELNDSGVCELEVKLRCMPRFWFVLMRFWLRVDKEMVRLRETRLYCSVNAEGLTMTHNGTDSIRENCKVLFCVRSSIVKVASRNLAQLVHHQRAQLTLL